MTTLTITQLAAVEELLRREGAVLCGPLGARLIEGGRSNLTYALSDGRACWVLRRPPAAGATPSAHDVAREFRVTSALSDADVPVAAPLLLCDDVAVLGAPFTVVEFVEGSSLRSSAVLDALSDDLLASCVTELVTTLARLHLVEPVEVGLGAFGRPDGYARRQLRRWSGQWDVVGQPSADADRLVARLADSIPEQRRTSVVHGDYRSDNTLVDLAAGGRVLAIVDWELSTLGDPVADVAMMCAYRHPALDLLLGVQSAWTSPRLPDADGLAAAYEAAGGAHLHSWAFHRALAFYKLAVIAAGIDHRHRAGGTTGDGFDTAADAVPLLLHAGLSIAGRP